jgi:hypothetical protein
MKPGSPVYSSCSRGIQFTLQPRAGEFSLKLMKQGSPVYIVQESRRVQFTAHEAGGVQFIAQEAGESSL